MNMRVFRNEINDPSHEGYALENGEKLRTFGLSARVGTSWQANLMVELVKFASGAWPRGETDKKGNGLHRMPSPEEVVSRAEQIVDMAISRMEAKGWTVRLPPIEELLDDNKSLMGFTTNE